MSRLETLVSNIQGVLNAYNTDQDIRRLLQLKKAIYPIDNLITLELSCGFVRWLKIQNRISPEQEQHMLESLANTNANANGFDILCKSDVGIPIIAEVKGTMPYKSDKYGSQQKESIKKDLEYLTGVRAKKKSKDVDINRYYKFMVMLKSQDGDQDVDAMKHLLKKFHLKDRVVILQDPDQELNLETVYVVFVDLGI